MGKYKVLTPKTAFPLYRKDPKSIESTIQKSSSYTGLYELQSKRKDSPQFILHDGPPYANGPPHVGHALNKILKDFVNRYKVLRGYRVHYRPGWDCHGLPIEQKASSSIPINAHPLTVRKVARDYAKSAIKTQEKVFRSWGVLGDWGRPYLTMSREYESNQIDVFYNMYQQGCIYRSFKPVYWSPSSVTALAEAELEYKDHTSPSVYVKFLSKFPQVLEGELVQSLVWTTTPWTLPGNRAICYNHSHQYSVIKTESSGELFLIGSDVLNEKGSELFGGYSVIGTYPGHSLQGGTYNNPLTHQLMITNEGALPFLPSSHVSSKEGTGLVHTAPAHGFDDYTVGKRYGLDLTSLVNERGCYDDWMGGDLSGLDVFKSGNEKIISLLRANNCLLHHAQHMHRYPFDWRTKEPVLIRSTKQWFASLETLRDRAIKALDEVKGIPPSSVRRVTEMIENSPEWCISRQRVWGLPIPVFYPLDKPDDYLITTDTIQHIKKLFLEHGSDSWWTLPLTQLLPPSLSKEAESYEKGSDTLDIWFDSGSSWATVVEGGVADVYLEGHDQYRGWFQSSLLTSVAVNNKSPYKQLVCHGFMLDGRGIKMSKSLGNVVDPVDITDEKKLGADGLRLLIALCDFTSDISLNNTLIEQVREFLLKIRTTVRFMIGNLSSFDPQKDLVPYSSLPPLERYMLHVLSEYFESVESLYEELNYCKICHLIDDLIRVDLSPFYYDMIKDCLYCDEAANLKRQSILTVLHYLLKYTTLSLGPILPHIAEEINNHYPLKEGQYYYYFLIIIFYFNLILNLSYGIWNFN